MVTAAAVLVTFSKKLEDSVAASTKSGKAAPGVDIALMANTTLVKSRFPKEWKQISQFFQLCSALDAFPIPVKLLVSYFEAAAASDTKSKRKSSFAGAGVDENVSICCVDLVLFMVVSCLLTCVCQNNCCCDWRRS